MSSPWFARRARAAAPLVLALAIAGLSAACDVLGDEDGTDGPSTTCLYNYESVSVVSDFGEACATDADCNHGVCMQPGDSGNITNSVFGFCTRGCDCDDSTDASLSGSNADYSCVYPGGCFTGASSQGAWRYAAPKCSSLADCTAIDSRYNRCASTNAETVIDGKACGQLHTVCQAN